MKERFLLVLASVTLALPIKAMAQDHPKLEVFGGYSLESIIPCGTGCREVGVTFPPTVFNGWNASVTGYVYKSFGVTADFSGHYASHVVYDPVVGNHRHSYLFGPTYAIRGSFGSVFVHTLFGETSSESDQLSNLNYTKFAWVLGCGLDVNVSPRVSVRVAQFDWKRATIPSFNTSDSTQVTNGFRYSGGVVFKF